MVTKVYLDRYYEKIMEALDIAGLVLQKEKSYAAKVLYDLTERLAQTAREMIYEFKDFDEA